MRCDETAGEISQSGIYARYYLGMTVSEIAEVEGCRSKPCP